MQVVEIPRCWYVEIVIAVVRVDVVKPVKKKGWLGIGTRAPVFTQPTPTET